MSDVVPEFVDPRAPPALTSPRPFRRGTWMAAIAMLPFMPKRIGVRLSVTSWCAAITAFLVCSVLALMIAGHILSTLYIPQPWFGFTTISSNSGPAPSSIEMEVDGGIVSRVQNVVTAALNMIFITTASLGDIYAVLGVIVASCVLCLFLGILASPYIATGERLGRLLGRSLKLSLFSSVMLVVTAMGAAAITHIGLRFPLQFENMEWTPTFITMSVIAVAWWFNIIVRMGRLYAGPADGPAWQPVRPRCLGCGYILTGLPCDGDCPECGLTIGDWLGENRETSAWAGARTLRNQPVGWLRSCRAVFRDREFFRRLDVSGAARKATDFAGVTSAIPAAIVAAAGLLAGIYASAPPAALFERIVCPVGLALAGLMGARFVFFAALSLIGLMVGYRRGVDPRVVTAAVCYCSVWLFPMLALACVVPIAIWWIPWLATPTDFIFPLSVIHSLILAVIPILVLVRLALQFRRSVRDVRGVGG